MTESGKMVSPGTPKEDFKVHCPCGCNEDDGLMIVCDICSFWQHAVCFCILNEEHAPEEHVCNTCAKADPKLKPTDPYLKGMSELAAQATCLWRRTLTAVVEFGRLLPHQLSNRLGVDINVAQGLTKRLEKEGFLITPNRGKRLGKVVVKEKLKKEGIPAYFKLAKKATEQHQDSVPEQEQTMDVAEDQNETSQAPQGKQQPKKGSKSSDVNSKLSQVTEQAANISIQSHQLRSSTARQKLSTTKARNERTHKTYNEGNKDKENDSRRGKKRAFSKVDQTEFEISNSQECNTAGATRRRKCSDASKSIVV